MKTADDYSIGDIVTNKVPVRNLNNQDIACYDMNHKFTVYDKLRAKILIRSLENGKEYFAFPDELNVINSVHFKSPNQLPKPIYELYLKNPLIHALANKAMMDLKSVEQVLVSIIEAQANLMQEDFDRKVEELMLSVSPVIINQG